jgi:hypothetical protein
MWTVLASSVFALPLLKLVQWFTLRSEYWETRGKQSPDIPTQNTTPETSEGEAIPGRSAAFV